MKKIFALLSILLTASILMGCETLFPPPDEVQIPENAQVATCNGGDIFKYIFLEGVVYEFYVNDVIQDSDMVDIVQEQVILNNESTVDYLESTFVEGACTYTDYE